MNISEILERVCTMYTTFFFENTQRSPHVGGEYLIFKKGCGYRLPFDKNIQIKNHGTEGASSFKVVKKKF